MAPRHKGKHSNAVCHAGFRRDGIDGLKRRPLQVRLQESCFFSLPFSRSESLREQFLKFCNSVKSCFSCRPVWKFFKFIFYQSDKYLPKRLKCSRQRLLRWTKQCHKDQKLALAKKAEDTQAALQKGKPRSKIKMLLRRVFSDELVATNWIRRKTNSSRQPQMQENFEMKDIHLPKMQLRSATKVSAANLEIVPRHSEMLIKH